MSPFSRFFPSLFPKTRNQKSKNLKERGLFLLSLEDRCLPAVSLLPSSNELPPSVIGTEFSQEFAITGGEGNFIYQESGDLPGGLIFTKEGLLEGIPQQTGTYSFTVTATDTAQGLTTTETYSLTSNQEAALFTAYSQPLTLTPQLNALTQSGGLSFSPSQLNALTVGKASTIQIQVAGGNPGDTYFLKATGALPPGMTFQSNGALTGTPTQPGSFNFTVTAIDNKQVNLTGSILYRLNVERINKLTPTGTVVKKDDNTEAYYTTINDIISTDKKLYVSSLNGFDQNSGNIVIQTSGGNVIASYSGTTPAVLPSASQTNSTPASFDGITFNSNVPGDFPIYWNSLVSQKKSNSPLELAPLILPPATVNALYAGYNYEYDAKTKNLNQKYIYQVTAFGGNPDPASGYTFSLVDGKGILPPGLALSKNGSIISSDNPDLPGKPTKPGLYKFTISVKDTNANTNTSSTATKDYTILVQEDPTKHYTPQQIQKSYGIDNIILSGGIKGDGTGQTIAILDKGDNPFFVDSSTKSTTISTKNNITITPLENGKDKTFNLPVISTEGFPESGFIPIEIKNNNTTGKNEDNYTGILNYTGITKTSFEGCNILVQGKNQDGDGILTPPITEISIENDYSIGYNASDLHKFSSKFRLPENQGFFRKIGGPKSPNTNSQFTFGETSQDVNWVHALAPGADIVLIEYYPDDLVSIGASRFSKTSADDAFIAALENQATVISNSYVNIKDENLHLQISDQSLKQLDSRTVTFVSAAGDNNKSFPPPFTSPSPAANPKALAAGMTALATDASGTYLGEVGNGRADFGYNTGYQLPDFQKDFTGNSNRTTPDVSFIGEATSTFDSGTTNVNGGLWKVANGTSLATPSWAALIAIANQGRTLIGQRALNGPNETLPTLYHLPASDYHKITYLDSGASSQYSETSLLGKDNFNQSGLGTPVANRLIPGLVGGHNTISGQVIAGGPQAGWTVYLSSQANDNLTSSSVQTTTDSNGNFSFLVAPGNYYAHAVAPKGWNLSPQSSQAIQFETGSDQIQGLSFNFSGAPNLVFVNNLYKLLLGRNPDPASQPWVTQLNQGTSPKLVIEGIEKSPEYLTRVVDNLYRHYLGRGSDPQRAGWVKQLLAGSTIEEVTAGIVSSHEFIQKFGGTNTNYVTNLYRLVLGRAGTSAEIQPWVNLLNQGESQLKVATSFLESREYYRVLVAGAGWNPNGGKADSTGYFQGYYLAFLKRQADKQGESYWVNQFLAGKTTDQEVLASILGSKEGFQLWS